MAKRTIRVLVAVVCIMAFPPHTPSAADIRAVPAAMAHPSPWDTDYFVNAEAGNDANAGTTPKGAWRTVARVNRTQFGPGDRVHFAGGQTFTGTINLTTAASENPDRAIVLTSYGEGRAIIDGGTGCGIIIRECKSITIEGLDIHGAGRNNGSAGDGIVLDRSKDVKIDRVSVSGFTGSGIKVRGGEKIRITNVRAHDNGFAGISTVAADGDAQERIEKLYIANCTAENNPGCPLVRDNHSGNGIVVSGVQGGLIEYCEAANNGWDMPWDGNGPVGIWAWRSNNVVIQHCVSHDNKTSERGKDGGGFDLDGGVTNSILQYNLSYQNEGAGFALCQYPGASVWKNNTIRYNISIDDGRKNGQAGILIWSANDGMSDALIHNNTIVNAFGHGVFHESGQRVSGLVFRNNLFSVSASGERFILGDHAGSTYENNLYWSPRCNELGNAQPSVEFDPRPLQADPKLHRPDLAAGLSVDTKNPATLQSCTLKEDSPCLEAGLVIDGGGSRDFWGNGLRQDRAPDIGAHQRN